MVLTHTAMETHSALRPQKYFLDFLSAGRLSDFLKSFLVHEAEDIKDNKDRYLHHPGRNAILKDAKSLTFMAM